MNILWVKPGKLLPLDTGGKLRTYNILRHLCAVHEVTYLSYYDGERDPRYEREILQYLPGTVCMHTGSARTNSFMRGIDYLLKLPSFLPYSVSKFTSSRVQQTLVDWGSKRRFDVAICDFLASTANFASEFTTPTVLFQHNVETVLWERRVRFETKWLNRVTAKIEFMKMRNYEAAQVARFHHVFAVSQQDRNTMSWMTSPKRISVIPTGVDLHKYSYDAKARPSSPLVVFTGSMDWAPNIDGVEYFCGEIWPRISQQMPEARFRIVGRDPHARIKKLASASIEVTGTVPSIVDHLREASVIVVPLRAGGGTRIKIYEGMAMGKATVSTHIGAEGLDVQHERDILLADDPATFAKHVVNLLLDDNLRRKYEAAAAATVQKYDWSVVTKTFVHALRETISASEPPTAVLRALNA